MCLEPACVNKMLDGCSCFQTLENPNELNCDCPVLEPQTSSDSSMTEEKGDKAKVSKVALLTNPGPMPCEEMFKCKLKHVYIRYADPGWLTHLFPALVFVGAKGV